MSEFDCIFEGDGRMPCKVRFEMDPDIVPVQEGPRRIPIAVRKALKTELDQLEARGIIEKSTHHSEWISNIVLQKKKDKNIRICLDPQFPNKAIRRPKYQMTTIEEVLPEMANAKVFSILDAKNGYWQVPLHEDSMDITTFWTPYGRYRFRVLPFGISASAEIYQQKQNEIVKGLEGVEAIADDLLVYGIGETYEMALRDHNRKLRNLFERLKENNVKLNKKKMRLAVTEAKFYGHIFTTNGIRPDEVKVDAILNMRKPSNIKETHTFLGMVTYLSKFLPNLTKMTEDLRDIIKTKVFKWSEKHELSFNTIKTLISRAPVLHYYDLKKKILQYKLMLLDKD